MTMDILNRNAQAIESLTPDELVAFYVGDSDSGSDMYLLFFPNGKHSSELLNDEQSSLKFIFGEEDEYNYSIGFQDRVLALKRNHNYEIGVTINPDSFQILKGNGIGESYRLNNINIGENAINKHLGGRHLFFRSYQSCFSESDKTINTISDLEFKLQESKTNL